MLDSSFWVRVYILDFMGLLVVTSKLVEEEMN